MQDEMKPRMQAEPVSNGEGAMARADLYRAAKNAMKLFQMVQENQELEGWVQAKITKSADYLDSVYHYMEYQVKFGGGATATSLDDITGEASAISAKNEVSEEDDETPIEMEESMNYEQRLHALLEGAKQKAMMAKKPAKKDEKVEEGSTGDYSAKKAAAGKDIGKPGKNFEKIAKSAAGRGGAKVAGAVLKKLRAKESVEEGFPTVASAKADAEKRKTTGKFDKKELKPGVTQYTRKSSTFNDGGDDTDVKKAKKKAKNEGVMDTVKKVAKKVGKAITGPDDEELLQRLEKETGGKRPPKKDEKVKEAKFDPLKHVKNPTAGEKTAAKDVKRSSYADRAAMLKSAEKDGRLKEASKPDFLDMDKDGDKKEPMKKAVADKKDGPKKGVNPFAKKNESIEVSKEVVTESSDLARMKQFLTRLNG